MALTEAKTMVEMRIRQAQNGWVVQQVHPHKEFICTSVPDVIEAVKYLITPLSARSSITAPSITTGCIPYEDVAPDPEEVLKKTP